MVSWVRRWGLIGILLLGLLLRFWQLATKPIWLDEVITALFSLGHSYLDVPLRQVVATADLAQIFSLKPATCAQIAATVSVQSVHPPLFFCWLHQWMQWLEPVALPWLWKLRAFAVLMGVGAIAAIYLLNRVLFSRRAGLMAAAFMAVSPFAVYLSQEARHYTLPMLLITLALLGLYQIYWDLQSGHQIRWLLWLGWVAVNSIGFYVHYFFLLAVGAQLATLALCLYLERRSRQRQELKDWAQQSEQLTTNYQKPQSFWAQILKLALPISCICLAYLPWLPTFLSHITRPETEWMNPIGPKWTRAIAPLYQLPLGWVLMFTTLPVERQPVWLQILSGGAMVLGFGYIVWRLAGRLQQVWQLPPAQPGLRFLGTYILVVLAEFFVIIYALGKDLTLVPRYNFIYFPAVCGLVGVALAWVSDRALKQPWRAFRLAGTVLLMATVSSALVVNNLAFHKPFYPDEVVKNLRSPADAPLLVGMMTYSSQDVALALSVALTLDRAERQTANPTSQFVLLPQLPGVPPNWQAIAQLNQPAPAALKFWLLALGQNYKSFPPTLRLTGADQTGMSCQIDPTQRFRRSIPHQLYRCKLSKSSG